MRNVYYTILVVACLIGSLTAKASTRAENSSGFTDIKLDLMKGNFLTSDEIANKNQVTFGIAIAEDGTQTRVSADDASANIVLKDFKYHRRAWSQSGYSHCKSTRSRKNLYWNMCLGW